MAVNLTAEARGLMVNLAAMPCLQLAALTHLALCRPQAVPEPDLVVLVGEAVLAGGRA